MIGDIDILVSKNELEKTYLIIKNCQYKLNKPITKFWKKRHIPKLINKNEICAIEIHDEVIKLNHKDLLLGCEGLNLNKSQMKLFNTRYLILNDLINDNNLINARISFKTFYDMKYVNDFKFESENNIYYERYNFILGQTNIISNNKNYHLHNLIFSIRYNLKKNFLFYTFDNFLCNIYENLNKYPYQFLEFILNKKYRLYVLKKLN